MLKRINFLMRLAVIGGIWTPAAWAVPMDDLMCSTDPQLAQTPVFFAAGARTCSDGTVQNDAGTCFYQVPCAVMTAEKRASFEKDLNTPWKDMTDPQKKLIFAGLHDNWLRTELSCKTINEPGVDAGTCPPPNECKRDAYAGMQPAQVDHRKGIPSTFIIEPTGAKAGVAK